MASEQETKCIQKSRIVEKVGTYYQDREQVRDEYNYMFKEDNVSLCKQFTQYICRWDTSCHLVMKEKVGDPKECVYWEDERNFRQEKRGTSLECVTIFG